MAIHYVDTYEGSDSNDGTSWAQAWKTCRPLTALYGSLGNVSNVEVRIAKTLPVQTAIPIFVSGTGRPLAGYRKAAIPDRAAPFANLLNWGGTAISPFSGNANEDTSSPYRPAGTFKFRIDCPAGSNGLAARWPITDGDFSGFECFEAVGAFYFISSEEPCPAEVWLEFATDIGGTNIIWSRKMNVGTTRFDARMCLVGNSDLPSGAAYAFLRINNPTASMVYLDCSGINAVLPVTHPNYVGLRHLYLPNDKMGAVLAPATGPAGNTTMNLVGRDSAGIDTVRALDAQAPRTWDCYRWEPYPYTPEAILPACAVAGTASNPLKVRGGWNKVSGVVDGVSVIDAANLRWFEGAIRVSVDVRNVALTFRRTNRFNQQGTPGIMERSGYGLNKQLLGCYAERLYISAPGPGCVGESINASESDDVREALVNASRWGLAMHPSNAGFRYCNTYVSLPFGGAVSFDSVEDSTWSQDRVKTLQGRSFVVRRCVLIDPRPVLDTLASEYTGGTSAPTYDDCDIIALSISIGYYNTDGACSPRAYLENCRLYGPHTGPTDPKYVSKNLSFTPIPGLPGPVCVSGADIDGLVLTHSDPVFHSTTPMFARTSHDADPVVVKLKNANVQMIFASFVPAPASNNYDYRNHSVELTNVTLHKTAASQGAPFKFARLKVDGLTMSGAWSAVQEGIVRSSEVDKLIFTDANTKIVDNFRFAGPAAGWGRVCASYRNIVHPIGLAGFLGTPSSGFNAVGAAWFHTLEGEMWASSVMTVTRDKTVSHSGLSSWKLSALQPIGAISRGSFMVGTVPVVAGVPVTFRAMMRRSSLEGLGGIFIRPAATREYVSPSTVNAPSLHDVVAMQNPALAEEQWELLEVTYTPYRDGLVELHAGRRGMPGSHVWLDSIKVTQ